MRDFFPKCRVALWSAMVYALAVKRHGLIETNRRVDAIIEQSKFWYELIVELHDELKEASIAGDLAGFAILESQFRSAVRRFNEEVALPLANLHK